jgi:NAD(P)-dependent dehydrogenase (short-subunit alcohol dehydrogenase family)
VLSKQPLPRLGQPADVAELALLLASENGSYITGQTFTVDGGFLLPGL